MSKYQFSMEKILDWRMEKESDAKKAVLQAQRMMQQQQTKLQHLINENTKVKHDHMKVTEINSLRYSHYLKTVIDEKIIAQKNLIDKANFDLEKAQNELLQAHQDRKAMEKLKEKEYMAVIDSEKMAEQRQLDEIATLNYKRVFY
ncbi:flagellar flij protein [Trichococcus palustris]|uniref:Flagellar FliJ protein n=1 Tax=Trichococcus palustris TaxID=140314 RepID=A0A143Z3R3_9LACT|nr:flagellar export protein FliJ [Trichococcus palustris]CZR02558.1 flagellar flij protein [Trichococcus palustris]SFL13478.1 flagellar FliJ protein [Trichococcus palustris]